jgi:CRISPR-associated protein Cmr2
MRNLLLFTIGPVQSFISQARKTQDLYAGSKLLSVLIGEAIKFVGEDNMIFPKYGKAMPGRCFS